MSARSKTPEEKLHRYIKRIQKIVGQKTKSPNLSPISKIKIQKSPVKIKTQNIDSYIKYQLTLKNINNFVQNYNRNLKSLFFSKIRGVQTKHAQTIYRFVAIQKEQILKPLVNKQFAIKFIIVALKNIVLNLYKSSFGQIKKKKKLIQVQIKRSNRIIDETKIKQTNYLKSERVHHQKQQKQQKNTCKSIRSEQFQRNNQFKVQNFNSKNIDCEINKRIENQKRKIRSCCILQNLIWVNLFKRKKQSLGILIQRKKKQFQNQTILSLKVSQQQAINMNQQIKKIKNQAIEDKQLILRQTQMLKQNEITLNQNLQRQQANNLLINQKLDSQKKYKKIIAAKLICISLIKSTLQKQKQIFSLLITNDQLYKQSLKSKTFSLISTLQKIQNKFMLLKFSVILKIVFLFSKNISQQRNQKQIIKQVVIQKVKQNKQFFVKLSNMNKTLSKMQNLNLLVHQNYKDAFKRIKNVCLIKISFNKLISILNNKIKLIFKDIKYYGGQKAKLSEKNKQNIKIDCIKKCSELFNKLEKKQLFLKIQFFSKLKHKSQTFFKQNFYTAVLSQELIKKQIQQFFGQRQKVKDKAVQNWQKTKETLIYQNLNKNQSNQKHMTASSINFSKNMKILS